MPARKRQIEDFDPNKSDSDDSDFDLKAARAKPTKPSRSGRSKPARKKRRTGGYGDASDDMSEGSELSDNESDSSDPESEATAEPEVDERTGRAKRKTKKVLDYGESDTDSIDYMNKVDEETTQKSTKNAASGQKNKKLVVKLHVNSPHPPTRRSARANSINTKRPTTSDSLASRRNTRSNQDEALIALTNSGNHAEITRPGTRSPESVAPRPVRGGKGMKKPPSMIEEADNESSAKTKTEPEEEGVNLEPEVAGSGDGDDAQLEEAADIEMGESAVVPESDDDEEDVIATMRSRKKKNAVDIQTEDADEGRTTSRSLRSAAKDRQARSTTRGRRKGIEDTSDFEPVADEANEEDISSSSDSDASPRKNSGDNEDSGSTARPSRKGGRTRASSRRVPSAENSDEADELAEELQELKSGRGRRRTAARAAADLSQDDRPQTRKRKPVDYRILRPDIAMAADADDDAAPAAGTPSRRGRGGGGGWARPLFSTFGPFGGAGGLAPVMGGPGGIGAVGGVDSDSSDDDAAPKARAPPAGVGGMVGMTPTAAAPPGFGAFPQPQAHSGDALQASLGKVKDKQSLADADPLGVDPNVNFDAVGGLQGHIDQLKEMVALPLLYPEVFQRFKVTPPRGVLFHGPPGTGKTLMARALASSVSSGGRKVTFYMRKGADALSKWVGEAERQLRLLFEEARKNQPSIIFFDEIDGLAPVRSNKQDQIHSSIVSTLLALMDGMDGRGQVIVVGATNRPDSVDPALRRPGRFDREFYFPLPGVEARRKILDIHTKNWEPPLPPVLKDELAELTKGYGGADLRALCTEAALNAVQRRYPQIYSSNEKLLIDPATINVAAKDFMLSVKKIVPSSERSASSGAAPLPKSVEPLLKEQLQKVEKIIAEILPQTKRPSALEEAKFADAEGEGSMRAERMQQEFERCRVFRPRLLIRGPLGMGQQYLAGALLNHFEGLHVQSFDLPTLLSDSTRSPESAVVQFFTEVKRHKPSVIYIPNVDVWYRSVGDAVLSTFNGLLRTLAPTDPVLVLGVLEGYPEEIDPLMVKTLFGYSKRNQFEIEKPSKDARKTYLSPIVEYLDTSPDQFPDPTDRKPRVLEKLAVAPLPPPKKAEPLTKEQKKAQKKKDRQTINMLKIRIQPIMDQIKLKYKLFRNGVIDDKSIRYLYEEADPNIVTSDMQILKAQFRPYEKKQDKRGEWGLEEQATDKFYYNMNSVLIEERLANGYYQRPKDFLADIKKLTKDARNIGDTNRLNKASELQANVEVDMGMIETEMPWLSPECEAVYQREKEREKEAYDKAKKRAEEEGRQIAPFQSNLPVEATDTTQAVAPVVPILRQPTVNGQGIAPTTPQRDPNQSSSINGISDLSNLQNKTDSNGNSVPSGQGDVPMSNTDDSPTTGRATQDSSFGPSAQTRPMHYSTGGPADLHQRQSYPHSLSQKSVLTPMAEGSNPAMYHNSASTTSSDKRNTGSTDLYNNTNSTNGQADPNSAPARMEPPKFLRKGSNDLSMLIGAEPSNSQLPSTQVLHHQFSQATIPSSSQSASQASQPHPPTFPCDILNSTPSRPSLIVDKQKSAAFLEELIQTTTSCSIEQLEQVYSALMSEIWLSRGSWNRSQVIDEVRGVLQELLIDMEAYQSFGPASNDLAY